jgi:hypothetical protein
MQIGKALKQPPWIGKVLTHYGFAALAAWWMATNIVQPFIDAHFETMRAVETGMDQLNDSMKDQTRTLRRIEDNTTP